MTNENDQLTTRRAASTIFVYLGKHVPTAEALDALEFPTPVAYMLRILRHAPLTGRRVDELAPVLELVEKNWLRDDEWTSSRHHLAMHYIRQIAFEQSREAAAISPYEHDFTINEATLQYIPSYLNNCGRERWKSEFAARFVEYWLAE